MMVGFDVTDLTRRRFHKILEFDDSLLSIPCINAVYGICNRGSEVTISTSEEFDGVVAIMSFLNSNIDVDERVFNEASRILVGKFKSKGGRVVSVSQIPDIIYEGIIAMLCHQKMPYINWIESDLDQPDLVFQPKFIDFSMRIAIECKNISRPKSSVPDKVRQICGAIESAVHQYEKRSLGFDGLLVFIDLPIEYLSMSKREVDELMSKVRIQLDLMSLDRICESQIVFSIWSQKDMYSIVLENGGLFPIRIVAPVTIGKSHARFSAATALFMSFLFRKDEESPNIYNWSKVARNINDPDQFGFD